MASTEIKPPPEVEDVAAEGDHISNQVDGENENVRHPPEREGIPLEYVHVIYI